MGNLCLVGVLFAATAVPSSNDIDLESRVRRPTAIALSPDGTVLVTANRSSGSLSVIDTSTSLVIAELDLDGRLTDLAFLDESHLFTTDDVNHQLIMLIHGASGWEVASRVDVPSYPVRLEVDSTGGRCYITSLWDRSVTRVDVLGIDQKSAAPSLRIAQSTKLPFEPRELCLAMDATKLVVAGSFSNELAVIDTPQLDIIGIRHIRGHNIRGLAVSHDSKRLLIAQQELNSHARSTRDDVHWGNLISNVLVSFSLREVCESDVSLLKDRKDYYLGEPGAGAGDPGAIYVGNEGQIAVLLSGVNQVTIGRDTGGRGLRRVPVGLRPSSVAASTDGRLFVANTNSDTVSVIDFAEAALERQIPLGPKPVLSLEERGENLFFDSTLSHDGWMSCNSCHTDGHSNGQLNDNLSDGSFDTPKRVLSLRGVRETGPWAWNGGVKSLEQQVRNSIQKTMQGNARSADEISAIVAFMKTIPSPPSFTAPLDSAGGGANPGRKLFDSLGCKRCHTPPFYTSRKSYDIGMTDSAGHELFNPPSLRGVGRRSGLFHDSRSTSLSDVFAVHKHQLQRELSDQELSALVKFLKSI